MKKIFILLFFVSYLCQAQTDSIRHEIRIVLENQDLSAWNSTIYINSLRAQGAEFINYNGVTHPSGDNYDIIGAGINLNVGDANPGYRSRNQLNSYTQLTAKGKTYATYNQGMPSDGSSVFIQVPFAAKHDWTYGFANIPVSQRKTYNHIPLDLNNLENLSDWVLDLNSDGHDTNPAYVDNFFRTDPTLQRAIAFVLDPKNKSRLWVTTDEGIAGQRVLCFVIGYGVKNGAKITDVYNHYSLFNTNLSSFGATSVNQAIGIPTMSGWKAATDTIRPPVDTLRPQVCWKITIKDTVVIGHRDSVYTATKSVPTYTHITINDSTAIACDTIPVDTSIQWTLYMAGANNKIGVPAKETIAINYLKQIGWNGYVAYNISSVLSGGGTKFTAFQNKLHANGFILGAVYGSVSELNLIESSGIRPDFLLSENEFWSVANNNSPSAIAQDTLIRGRANRLAAKLGIKNESYIGWPSQAAVPELKALDQRINIHCYRPSNIGLDSGYVKTRLNLFGGYDGDYGVITSFENIFFGGGWTKTHQLSEIYTYMKPVFKGKLKRVLGFTDDQLMATVPYKMPLLMLIIRLGIAPNYIDKTTKGLTLPSHIKDSIIPNSTPEKK